MEPAYTCTVEEAARLLRISRGLAYARIATGDIPHIRIGGRILVLREVLVARLLNTTARVERALEAYDVGDASLGRQILVDLLSDVGRLGRAA